MRLGVFFSENPQTHSGAKVLKISGYVPVTIADQLCNDSIFHGPIVVLIITQRVEILAEHRAHFAEQ